MSTQNIHTQGPCQYHIATTPQTSYFGYPSEIKTISKETYCPDYSQKHGYLNQPLLPDEALLTIELRNGSVILPTKILNNLSQSQTSPLPIGYMSLEEKVILNNPTSPMVKRQRSSLRNADETNSPPSVMPAPIIPTMRTY
ncbi:uncharacterized protein DS421_9g263060 [Arachis hypogaea]|nr:uncharacterized protein DS421_9g263060 [Arachis hypogaea]